MRKRNAAHIPRYPRRKSVQLGAETAQYITRVADRRGWSEATVIRDMIECAINTANYDDHPEEPYVIRVS